ncbi:hypothetical protein Tco_1159896 [Tanacetum coccineum]
MGEGLAIPTDPHHTPTFIQPYTQHQKTQKPRKPKRKDTQVPQPSDPIGSVIDEAIHKELGDSLVMAATTASSLEAEQDSGNIDNTQSKAKSNESSSLGTNSGGGPMCQQTMGDTIAQTRFENVSKYFNDSLLARGNTLRSDEDRLKLDELMALCTTLQTGFLIWRRQRPLNIMRLLNPLMMKKVLGDDASKQGRIDADEEITLVSVHDMNVFAVSAAGDLVSAASAATTITLEEMKSTKPKKKGIVIQELGESTTTISSQQSQDKGKGILIEHVKKKDLILLDEETALNLQAEFDEEERLAREKAEKEEEANIALIETWDDI